jgi:hypothetical protein
LTDLGSREDAETGSSRSIPQIVLPDLPFGSIKSSGCGREFSTGIQEFGKSRFSSLRSRCAGIGVTSSSVDREHDKE